MLRFDKETKFISENNNFYEISDYIDVETGKHEYRYENYNVIKVNNETYKILTDKPIIIKKMKHENDWLDCENSSYKHLNEVYCPSCGKKEIYEDMGMDDYYVGCEFLCRLCGCNFYLLDLNKKED